MSFTTVVLFNLAPFLISLNKAPRSEDWDGLVDTLSGGGRGTLGGGGGGTGKEDTEGTVRRADWWNSTEGISAFVTELRFDFDLKSNVHVMRLQTGKQCGQMTARKYRTGCCAI